MRPTMKDLLMDTAGRTKTENGAITNATTGSEVLNLFALGGAVRERTIQEVVNLIDAAWKEDEDLALRTIFYLADVRGGQGERDFFFNALRYLADKNLDVVERIIPIIPEYSRSDMLFAFIGTRAESYALSVLKEQFLKDLESESPTLLAKWLPSPRTKSQTKLAVKVARAFGMRLEDYRKRRADLNRKIDTVEIKMSAQKWDEIDYEKVPAKAFMNYQKAFEKHGYEKMEEFVEKIKSGEVKVKSKTLYPHEIVMKAMYAQGNEVATLESAWENLPNFIGDGRTGIPVIDTSASMTWGGQPLPIWVAKSMGLYLSERLSGAFKDHYITFSSKPIMQKIHGSNLAQKISNMKVINDNTDIEKVYMLILDTALRNKMPQEDMPTHLYIFSDMEFDTATRSVSNKVNATLFEKIKETYHNAGYEMPVTIFWNLQARQNQSPVKQHDSGAVLVSGFSPSTFKFITNGRLVTPYETMMNVLNSPRYEILSSIAFDLVEK